MVMEMAVVVHSLAAHSRSPELRRTAERRQSAAFVLLLRSLEINVTDL